MSDDLVAFLRARLEDDLATADRLLEIMKSRTDAAHWGVRMLAEVNAKRALIAETIEPYLGMDTTMARVANQALRLLALPYADHPDYRPEWRP